MAWRITSGPDSGPWEGRDAVGWLWFLERDDGATRRVLVEVSGTAMATADEYLPSETGEARRSRGRSEIEKVLEDDEPPRRISLGTMGYVETPA